ncbi:hypothetical protein [Dolichospermum phage Dfl-JY45]
MRTFLSRVREVAVLTAVAIGVSACGGGTTQTAQENAVTQRSLSVSVELVDSANASRNRFSEGDQFDARVTVTERVQQVSSGRTLSDTSGPAANVTVALQASGATVQPVSGTALSDSRGQATFRLTAGQLAGAFGITVRAELAGVSPVERSVPFAVDRTIQPRLSLQLLDAQGNPVSSARPGDEIRVRVSAQKVRENAIGVSQQFEPAGNVRVDLSAESGRFDPSGSQIVTDAAGEGAALYVPGLFNGAVRVTAAATIEGKLATSIATVDVRVPQVRVGYGAPFVAGLRIDPPEIEAGTDARISAQLLREDGVLFEEPVSVRFESACASQGAANLLSPVLSAGGSIATVYSARGCVGQDRIRAIIEIPGLSQPAVGEGLLRIRAPRAEGIAFVSAEPVDIALRGRASPERPDASRVTFEVRNAAGLPVPAAPVSFELTGQIGDTTLLAPSGVTGPDGRVTAVVRAGDAAAVVAVQARVTGTNFVTTSRQVTVSTGGADQDSFSLSLSTLNVEGFDIDGQRATISVRAADRFNNPVADGTAVLFTTEGGAIPARCETSGGLCTVDLVTQQPRPSNGRVTILARTEGSESFVDLNGNGLFDVGEPFDDLPEAWLDANENGLWDVGEFFADANNNGRYDGANGRFDGGPCAVPAACGLAADVRGQAVLVFATSLASIQISPDPIVVDDVTPREVQILISDRNGNLPPAGSRVEVTTSNGTLLTEVEGELGNSNARGPYVIRVAIIGDGEASTGILSVRVTSPSGAVTTATARVIDSSVCDPSSGFSPPPPQCQANQPQVGSLSVTPETISVAAGSSIEQNVTVRVLSSANPPAGVAGVTPSVSCTTSNGVSGEVVAGIQSTAASGETTVRIRATAGPSAAGDASCSVSAGGRSATVRLAGPASGSNQPGAISVTPTTVNLQANQSNREVRLLATVRNSATPAAPLAGVTPSVRCSSANAVGIVINPGIVPPTNASGQTEVPVFYNTDAAPSGSVVCEVSAGSAVTTVSFAP